MSRPEEPAADAFRGVENGDMAEAVSIGHRQIKEEKRGAKQRPVALRLPVYANTADGKSKCRRRLTRFRRGIAPACSTNRKTPITGSPQPGFKKPAAEVPDAIAAKA
jgi:hypothetical protein